MIHEWCEPKPVYVVPNESIPDGNGVSFAVIDYGPENHIIWGVAFDDTGQVWWVPNPLVRFRPNASMGRSKPE